MKTMVWVVVVAGAVGCVGCDGGDVAGVYEAKVAFRGKDPRFAGEHYIWQLAVNPDGSFSFTFELPLAVYTEDGRERVGKGKGMVEGDWVRKGGRVVLTRKSGAGSLGCTDTMVFSFRDNQLEVSISGETAVVGSGENRLELRRLPERGLTAEQRKIADAVVGRQIREVRARIIAKAELGGNIRRLSRRKKRWGGWQPAMRVGFCVKRCKEAHVAVPRRIDESVVDDIIWQYENAYGSGNDLKYHREECARALGFIGHPKGVPTILKSLGREGGHFSWAALEGMSDERFIGAIEEHLDFTSQQDAFPAMRCLAGIGPASIATLRRFVGGDDKALRREAVNSLIEIEAAECVSVLEELSKDGELGAKAEAGVLRIRCRAIDEIYDVPRREPEDESRLYYLTSRALFDEDEKARGQAAEAVLKIGEPAVWHLRQQLANDSHRDRPGTPEFFISERACELLGRIGEPAVAALIDALCDEEEHSRRFAAEALRRITGETLDSKYDEWRDWYFQRQRGESM
jgi:hypothetical protein